MATRKSTKASKAWVSVCVLVGLLAATARALNIETVPVGDPGNAGELSGAGAGGGGPDRICGSVSYTYNIGKYEVTTDQYTEFLNKVAKADRYGLYNLNMDTAFSPYGCGIMRTGSSGSYVYSVGSGFANRPVSWVSWADAARCANWLHNGQLTRGTGLGDYGGRGLLPEWRDERCSPVGSEPQEQLEVGDHQRG